MMDKKAMRHIQNKQHSDRSKPLLISNYFKCKWIKLRHLFLIKEYSF